MEDWAYAGSWENNVTSARPIKQCEPNSYYKYDKTRTQYDDTSLRNIMYLVETAFVKKPIDSELGNDDTNVFHEGNHIE
jgi:hypothetical protein